MNTETAANTSLWQLLICGCSRCTTQHTLASSHCVNYAKSRLKCSRLSAAMQAHTHTHTRSWHKAAYLLGSAYKNPSFSELYRRTLSPSYSGHSLSAIACLVANFSSLKDEYMYVT